MVVNDLHVFLKTRVFAVTSRPPFLLRLRGSVQGGFVSEVVSKLSTFKVSRERNRRAVG